MNVLIRALFLIIVHVLWLNIVSYSDTNAQQTLVMKNQTFTRNVDHVNDTLIFQLCNIKGYIRANNLKIGKSTVNNYVQAANNIIIKSSIVRKHIDGEKDVRISNSQIYGGIDGRRIKIDQFSKIIGYVHATSNYVVIDASEVSGDIIGHNTHTEVKSSSIDGSIRTQSTVIDGTSAISGNVIAVATINDGFFAGSITHATTINNGIFAGNLFFENIARPVVTGGIVLPTATIYIPVLSSTGASTGTYQPYTPRDDDFIDMSDKSWMNALVAGTACQVRPNYVKQFTIPYGDSTVAIQLTQQVRKTFDGRYECDLKSNVNWGKANNLLKKQKTDKLPNHAKYRTASAFKRTDDKKLSHNEKSPVTQNDNNKLTSDHRKTDPNDELPKQQMSAKTGISHNVQTMQTDQLSIATEQHAQSALKTLILNNPVETVQSKGQTTNVHVDKSTIIISSNQGVDKATKPVFFNSLQLKT